MSQEAKKPAQRRLKLPQGYEPPNKRRQSLLTAFVTSSPKREQDAAAAADDETGSSQSAVLATPPRPPRRSPRSQKAKAVPAASPAVSTRKRTAAAAKKKTTTSSKKAATTARGGKRKKMEEEDDEEEEVEEVEDDDDDDDDDAEDDFVPDEDEEEPPEEADEDGGDEGDEDEDEPKAGKGKKKRTANNKASAAKTKKAPAVATRAAKRRKIAVASDGDETGGGGEMDIEEEAKKRSKSTTPAKTKTQAKKAASSSATSGKKRARDEDEDDEAEMEVEAEDDDEEEANDGADLMSIAGGAEKLASGELVFASDPKVHAQFVKKLNAVGSALQTSPTKSPSKSRAAAAVGKSGGGVKYTPLEQQFVAVKEKNPDVLLIVECGYRCRFFGEDAEIASKVLHIACFQAHNFMNASIPTNRLHIHTKRLVEQGYKVGLVKQTETAAIKAAGATKSGPFARELSAIYTKATYIPEDVETIATVGGTASSPNYLMCLYEQLNEDNTDSVHFSILAIQLSTGDIVYDDFDDDFAREALETRILHLQPAELILQQTLTPQTTRLLNRLCPSEATLGINKTLVENLEDYLWDYDSAIGTAMEFYAVSPSKRPSLHGVKFGSGEALPNGVVICLSMMIGRLEKCQLEDVLRLTSNFRHFTRASTMSVSGITATNLEFFNNQDNGHYKGSLYWLMNHTQTAFGARLLRKWLQQPLLEKKFIDERLDAVAELMETSAPAIKLMLDVVKALPDLERGLVQCHYKRCSPQAFLSLLQSFKKVSKCAPPRAALEQQVKSTLLRSLLHYPDMCDDVDYFLNAMSTKAAQTGKKRKLFVDSDQFPEVAKYHSEIENVKKKLHDHLAEVRDELNMPSLDYVTRSNAKYLIELTLAKAKSIPKDWVLVNGTTKLGRYQTPKIVGLMQKMALNKEKLTIAAEQAWDAFLGEFKAKYDVFHEVMRKLGALDCLDSLAALAKGRPGYVRPIICDDEHRKLEIVDGRHPVVEALMTDPFVPNAISMRSDAQRCMVLTGPNMGGKTSYIKQVALIVAMAQIGSFVPAESACLSPVDAIHTRMGASDNLERGQSTFYVELQETSSILQKATDRSLVILDELGRGTSTHDGVAIAYATLDHTIRNIRCFTIFVTHYPLLAQLEEVYPSVVGNYHMAFMEHEKERKEDDPSTTITFLYKLTEGAAKKSYGLNVARLAELPSEVIAVASKKSHELEESVKQKAERRNNTAVQKLKDLYRALSALKATEDGGGDGQQQQQQEPGHEEGMKEEVDEATIINNSNSWHTKMAQISSLLGLCKSQAT